MTRLFRSLVIVAAIALTGSAYAEGVTLSDAEAKRVIEEIWNSIQPRSVQAIPIGQLTVVGGPVGSGQRTGCGTGRLTEDQVKLLRIAQSIGLVTIEVDRSFEQFRQGQSFSWDQMLSMTTGGVQGKLSVALTDKGRQLDVSRSAPAGMHSPNCLLLRSGTFSVTRVVRNEAHRKGLSDYRAVFVTYSAQWSPVVQQLVQQSGGRLSNDRKAIVLLKHDAFSNKWTRITEDVANADEEFTAQNVAVTLERAN